MPTLPERPRRSYLGVTTLPSWRSVPPRTKLYLAVSVLCLVLAKAANIVIPVLYGALTDSLTLRGGQATSGSAPVYRRDLV